MSPDKKMEQKSGKESVNVQAGHDVHIHHGLSLEDTRKVALEVFEANFYRLSDIAASTARQRAEEITNDFLKAIEDRNPDGLKSAENPEFQAALYTVQKEYARTGDEDLKTLLIDLLIDQTKEEARSLEHIVLGEALQTLPKITQSQVDTLSLIFVLRFTRYLKMSDIETLKSYIETHIATFVKALPPIEKNSHYQHLEYAACVSIEMGYPNIVERFLKLYPGLFSKGFEEKEAHHIFGENQPPEGLFIPCFHDDRKMQLNPLIDSGNLQKFGESIQLEDSKIKRLMSIPERFIMSDGDAERFLKSLHPCIAELLHYWQTSLLGRCNLTSVGIAIGHSNLNRITGDKSDLSIWI